MSVENVELGVGPMQEDLESCSHIDENALSDVYQEKVAPTADGEAVSDKLINDESSADVEIEEEPEEGEEKQEETEPNKLVLNEADGDNEVENMISTEDNDIDIQKGDVDDSVNIVNQEADENDNELMNEGDIEQSNEVEEQNEGSLTGNIAENDIPVECETSNVDNNEMSDEVENIPMESEGQIIDSKDEEACDEPDEVIPKESEDQIVESKVEEVCDEPDEVIPKESEEQIVESKDHEEPCDEPDEVIPKESEEQIVESKVEEVCDEPDEVIPKESEEQIVESKDDEEACDEPDENITVQSEGQIGESKDEINVDETGESEKVEQITEEKINVNSKDAVESNDQKCIADNFNKTENTNDNCYVCSTVVYALERLTTKIGTCHKTCFRCTKCNKNLTSSNYSFNKDKPYCSPHYMELFKKRGKYDDDDNIDESVNGGNSNKQAEHVTTSEVTEDELPAPDTTKSIVASIESRTYDTAVSGNKEDLQNLPIQNITKTLAEKFTALGTQQNNDDNSRPPPIKLDLEIQDETNAVSNGHGSENVPRTPDSNVIRSNQAISDDKPQSGTAKLMAEKFNKVAISNN